MFISTAGYTILFVASLVGTTIVGGLWAAYAAHSYLVVMEDTAGGLDEVRWPDLLMYDWMGRWLYFPAVIAFWFVPAAFVVFLLAPAALEPSVALVLVLFTVVWLFLPISLLSSLSSPNPWIIVYPALLGRVGRHPLGLAIYYAMSGCSLAAGGALAVLGVVRPLWLPLAAPAACALLLIHARLLGRLAYLVSQGPTPKPRRKKKRSKDRRAKTAPDEHVMATARRTTPVHEQSIQELGPRVPEEEEDEWELRKRPYAVGPEAPRPETQPFPLDGYRPVGEPVFPETDPDVPVLTRPELLRVRPGLTSRQVFFTRLLSFLGHERTLRCWFSLSLVTLVLGLLLHGVMVFWPVG